MIKTCFWIKHWNLLYTLTNHLRYLTLWREKRWIIMFFIDQSVPVFFFFFFQRKPGLLLPFMLYRFLVLFQDIFMVYFSRQAMTIAFAFVFDFLAGMYVYESRSLFRLHESSFITKSSRFFDRNPCQNCDRNFFIFCIPKKKSLHPLVSRHIYWSIMKAEAQEPKSQLRARWWALLKNSQTSRSWWGPQPTSRSIVSHTRYF